MPVCNGITMPTVTCNWCPRCGALLREALVEDERYGEHDPRRFQVFWIEADGDARHVCTPVQEETHEETERKL